ALRSKSINELKKLAKKYNIDIPKEIKNIKYWAKRIGNKIEDFQYKNYESGIKKKSSGVKFDTIKKAEAKFRSSFGFATELEKEVFLKNKTARFLDKFEVGSPLNFYNFKNEQEFNKVMKSIAAELREQFKRDYIKMLKHNNPKEITKRLEKSFNKKKEGFYNPTNLSSSLIVDDFNFNKKFRELDYIRKMEMLSIMDETEYSLMVESLIKQGFSEPLAMEVALNNLGFRKNDKYQLLE
ncbi:MAG: hypothetical protein ACI31M_00930, partial [Bacilli bacterium]